MPIIISANLIKNTCSISNQGVGIAQSVIDQAKWKIGDKVEAGFIPETKCMLLSHITKSDNAFMLCHANAKKKKGGRIYCQAFIRNYLQAITILPKYKVAPLFIDDNRWRIALLLDELEWRIHDFTRAEVENIDDVTYGVYELLGKENSILRVGEGKVKDRIKDHLKDTTRFSPIVKKFRFVALSSKEDVCLMEKVLITKYQNETGTLPPLNYIKA